MSRPVEYVERIMKLGSRHARRDALNQVPSHLREAVRRMVEAEFGRRKGAR